MRVVEGLKNNIILIYSLIHTQRFTIPRAAMADVPGITPRMPSQPMHC